LDLTNNKAMQMPNVDITLAIYFRKLKVLDVSFNRIRSIEANGLSKACPYLERFNFSHNFVDDLREILPLGKLKHLYELEFMNNPVVATDEKRKEVRERV
jgi:Leucine-rich repeat (LRR) protein